MKYLIIILVLAPASLVAQCNGISQWPSSTLNAPNWAMDTTFVSNMFAGEYSIVLDFKPDETYNISSSAPVPDYITVTKELNNTVPGYEVIGHGVSPLDIVIPEEGPYYVHVNLAIGCGSENEFRNISYACSTCPEVNNVGIGTEEPVSSAILDIQSTTQGVRLPTMTTAQRDAIGDPVDGLSIYNVDISALESYSESTGEWETYKVEKQLKKVHLNAFDFFPFDDSDYDSYVINGYVGRGGLGSGSGGTTLAKPLNFPVGTVIRKIVARYIDTDPACCQSDSYIQMVGSNTVSSNNIFPIEQVLPGSDGSNNLKTHTINYPISILDDYHYVIYILSTNADRILLSLTIEYEEG